MIEREELRLGDERDFQRERERDMRRGEMSRKERRGDKIEKGRQTDID